MSLKDLLEDQRIFNRLIWDPAKSGNVVERIRDLTFGMIEESLEFIRTYEFKVHRRSKLRLQNVAHSHEELVDMFKYWLSLVDVTDFPIEKLDELYYAKSRVVQYRYQEEWLSKIEVGHPLVIVDIDQVLADYITGICLWAREWSSKILKLSSSETVRLQYRLTDLQMNRKWINAESVGIPYLEWQKIKHDFRTRGGKRTLPVFDDAQTFLKWCRAKGWIIILVTSRPINEYPNLFSDTLFWLEKNELPFDFVWWSAEKAERLEEANMQMRKQIVFAVDDSEKFVNQFRAKGVKAYHLDRNMPPFNETDPTYDKLRVRSLHDLMSREGSRRLNFGLEEAIAEKENR